MYIWNITKNKNIGILKKICENSNIIGKCNFSISKNICYINNIYIDKQYRNNYIGSTLLRKVEEYSKQNNINKINMIIHKEFFEKTEEFYIKNGYKKSNINNYNTYDDGLKTYYLSKYSKKI